MVSLPPPRCRLVLSCTENDSMVCNPWNFRINGTMTFIKQFHWSSGGRSVNVVGWKEDIPQTMWIYFMYSNLYLLIPYLITYFLISNLESLDLVIIWIRLKCSGIWSFHLVSQDDTASDSNDSLKEVTDLAITWHPQNLEIL